MITASDPRVDRGLVGRDWLTSKCDWRMCEHQIALLALTGSAGIRPSSVRLASRAPEQIGHAR